MKFATQFHMSNDSEKFRTHTELSGAGAALDVDGRFQDGRGTVWLPLYEAKMIHQYDHRFATYEGPAEAERSREMTAAEHADPAALPQPRYWVEEREVERVVRQSAAQHRGWFLGFRDIARNTDVRTAIFAILPWAAVGHTMPLMSTTQSPKHMAALLACANAFVFDYVVRQKTGGTHLAYSILKQIPVLPPETFTPSLLEQIVPRVLELTYTAHDLAPFARDCGYDGPPFRWDPERRAQLRAELDGIYAHLYGLSRDDFAYILDTFPIVRRNDEKAFNGEYRTKRLCLEAYDYFSEGALDALGREVKRLEVGLRRLIDRTLGPGQGALPPAIREKVLGREKQYKGERAAEALRAAPLGTFLDACYLIELKAIMASSELWPRFAARFGEKPELERRFQRVNDLRNPLAHNRALPDDVRRAGEEAVAWFTERVD